MHDYWLNDDYRVRSGILYKFDSVLLVNTYLYIYIMYSVLFSSTESYMGRWYKILYINIRKKNIKIVLNYIFCLSVSKDNSAIAVT